MKKSDVWVQLFAVGFIFIALVAFSFSFYTNPPAGSARPDRLSQIEAKLADMAFHLECVGRSVGAGKDTVSGRSHGRLYFEWKKDTTLTSLMSSRDGSRETEGKLDRLAAQLDRVERAVGMLLYEP